MTGIVKFNTDRPRPKLAKFYFSNVSEKVGFHKFS